MLRINDKREIVVEPSYTPLGTGEVIIATHENAGNVFNALCTWIKGSTNETITLNGVKWYLSEKSLKDNVFILSYSAKGSTIKTELYRDPKIAGIIEWVTEQFKPIFPSPSIESKMQ